MRPHKYDQRIDLSVDNAHSWVIRRVGTGKRVLEVGCATGRMSQVLVEQFGCTVVGVEIDPAAASEAVRFCHRIIIADLDMIDLAHELGPERFDVIVAADVLEHLRSPERLLAALRPFLVPSGYVVASVPNIGHASIIAELLDGRFTYRPLGLLDETHLRFFTRKSICECFEYAGFGVSSVERLEVEPAETEFHTDLGRFPRRVVEAIRAQGAQPGAQSGEVRPRC